MDRPESDFDRWDVSGTRVIFSQTHGQRWIRDQIVTHLNHCQCQLVTFPYFAFVAWSLASFSVSSRLYSHHPMLTEETLPTGCLAYASNMAALWPCFLCQRVSSRYQSVGILLLPNKYVY